jgi:hypothetical protein
MDENSNCSGCLGVLHKSDCAIHNAPALPVGECDCGAIKVAAEESGVAEFIHQQAK